VTLAVLIWSNLVRRPARTSLAAASVALGVGLIVALLSIAAGVGTAASDLIHVGRADLALFQGGVSDLTRSLLPASLAGRVARAPGVAATARVDILVTKTAGNDSFLLLGLDPGEFPARRLVVTSGRRPREGEALVGDAAAGGLRVASGGQVRIAGRTFVVAGLYHSGNAFEDAGAVAPLSVVQRLAGRPGEVTSIAVEARPGVAPKELGRALERRFPGLVAVAEPGQAVRVDTSTRLLIDGGWVFSLMAVLVGAVLVANTMAMSVNERTPEIGLLRAIGWRARRIGVVLAGEAAVIGLVGLVVGTIAGYVAARLVVRTGALSALVEPAFGPRLVGWATLVALGVSILGSAYPAWRAVRLAPLAALRRD
jgi:putative ABC transport system permease protein